MARELREGSFLKELLGPKWRDISTVEEPSDLLLGTFIGDTVTVFVAYLRDPSRFPNLKVNKLTYLLWDLVGNDWCPCVVAEVPTLSFAAERNTRTGLTQSFILVPFQWLEQIEKNPEEQIAAVVYVASQVVDFYSGRLGGTESRQLVLDRAATYEVEALKTLKNLHSEMVHTPYQQQLLEQYQDFDGNPDIYYEPPPYEG